MSRGTYHDKADYLRDSTGAELWNKLVFARLVKRGRFLSRKSLKDVALKVNKSPATISNWENRRCASSLETRVNVINLLRIWVSRITIWSDGSVTYP